MQHEIWCRDHRPPLDETQAWTPCISPPGAEAGPTAAWLTVDEDGRTVVDIDHDPRTSIPVQAFAEFCDAGLRMAVKGGAVLPLPRPPTGQG